MAEGISLELDPFDLTTLKIVLCGTETIKEMVQKYPRHTKKRTTLHDSLKRLIAANLILKPTQQEEGDSRQMIYTPNIEELNFWTYFFQFSFGLGLKEILSVFAPDKLNSFIKTVKRLTLQKRINEIIPHAHLLLKEYAALPKEEWKNVFEKNKDSALAREIEKYWRCTDRLQPFEKNKFIEAKFNAEQFFTGFYFTLAKTKPAHLFEIKDRGQRENLKEIIAYLNTIGLDYYFTTKGTLEEKKQQLEGIVNTFDFLSRSSQARKEFEKQIKPEFKETLKRFEEAIK